MNSKKDYNPYSVHPVLSLGLGLNDQMDASQIQDNEIADCENFSIEQGTLSTAPGYVQWDDAPQTHPGPYWGGVFFVKSNGTQIDVRQRQDKLEYSPNGDPTWYPCVMPTTGSPATALKLTQCQPTFAALNDILIFTNGFENVLSSTDGITWTIQASLPKCKVVFENAKNRVIYLNQTGTNRSFRFDWSNINDPLTIGASSYQLLDPNNYGKVVAAGLTPDGTTLIFKENAVYSVADVVDNGIIDINFIGQASVSCHQTVATTRSSVIWCGQWDGVWEYIGGTIRQISGRITMVGRNDTYRGDLFCGAYYNNKYHLSRPDVTVSEEYNSQEYIIYLNVPRQDPLQPYAITRNRRYVGCYWVEAGTFDYGQDYTLYIGDSRLATTSGSPARYDNTVFAWVNDYRDTTFSSEGLAGMEQTCYFVTKYFTEGMAYYAKKYKKIFTNMKLLQTTTVTLSYRFVPYGPWTDTTTDILVELVNFLEGYGFSEGYGFANETLGSSFVDINNPEKPRGIQFKFSVTTTKEISYLSLAFSFLTKFKFK